MSSSAPHIAHALRELPALAEPLAAFERLRPGKCPWLLDSALPATPRSRFSFAGSDPYLVLRARGRTVELECLRAAAPGLAPGRRRLRGDPLEIARSCLPRLPGLDASAIPFLAGAVGYLGYELAEQLDVHALHGSDDLSLPDLLLLFMDRIAVFDHERRRGWASAIGLADTAAGARRRAEQAAENLVGRLASSPGPHRAVTASPTPRDEPLPDLDPAAFAKAVAAVKEAIAAGNVYQACLTYRVDRCYAGDPWALYRTLRRANPAPFAAYLELPEVAIASSSPERFLALSRDGWAESRPIKGTRPRGRHPIEDAAQRRALEGSEKDRAENLMIVDLVRNDLGRVCETGSVSVPELMAVEAYASVFQMVSTVRGRLRRDRDAFDLVRATFPPGSMTGAPKIAAMQLLDRLESRRRAVYSGAIGYFDVGGGADLSVAIRTALLARGRAHVHTGGGIVADSDPGEEYRESRAKALPLLALLEV